MHQIPMAVDAALFVTGPGVNDRSVCEHGPSFFGYVEEVAMAFHALRVFDCPIGGLPVFFPIVFILHEMHNDVFYSVPCLGIKEIESVAGSR
jgi:hypothetical protein